jgi:hypothetical protein
MVVAYVKTLSLEPIVHEAIFGPWAKGNGVVGRRHGL